MDFNKFWILNKLKLNDYLTSIPNSYWTLPLLFKPIYNKPYNIFDIINFNNIYSSISVYGSPCFKWNSGRTGELDLSLDLIELNINQFNRVGISCYLTFTSYWLVYKDLQDKLGNSLLEILNASSVKYNISNGIILSSDVLYNHIYKKYPKLKLKCSLIKSVYENTSHSIDWYSHMLDLYDIVVSHVDCPINILNKLSYENKARIEILVNETCIRNCPNRQTCYKEQKDFSNIKSPNCKKQNTSIPDNERCYMSLDEILLLTTMGFSRFKIQGR